MMLGIAYAASIGGIGTLIGTPPNLMLAGFAHTLLDKTITFRDWLVIGLPLVVVLLPLETEDKKQEARSQRSKNRKWNRGFSPVIEYTRASVSGDPISQSSNLLILNISVFSVSLWRKIL